MTLEELYELIGGNYEQAVKVMRKEKLIDRYVRKFVNSDLCDKLVEAGQSMDETQLHENAHALKGVCANLGLDSLAEAASDITEEFRPGNPRQYSDDEVREKLSALESAYQRTVAGITQYMEA